MLVETMWTGRGPLTEWPEIDWWYYKHHEGFEPIWDRQPRTTSMALAGYITGRDGREGRWTYGDSTPGYVRQDTIDYMEQRWARIKALLREAPLPTPTADAPQPKRLVVKKSTAEELAVEVKHVERTSGMRSMPVRGEEVLASCAATNKVRHKSKLWALHHRNELAAKPDAIQPERLAAYKCGMCGDWHVGHTA